MDYNTINQKIENIIDKMEDILITSLTCSNTKLELLQVKFEFIEKMIADKKEERKQAKANTW